MMMSFCEQSSTFNATGCFASNSTFHPGRACHTATQVVKSGMLFCVRAPRPSSRLTRKTAEAARNHPDLKQRAFDLHQGARSANNHEKQRKAHHPLRVPRALR